MRIFVDVPLTQEAMKLLQDSILGHQLVLPNNPTKSVLEMAKWDENISNAEVFFGQPDPLFIEKANNLKWIHVSSSGITRYDNPFFRNLVAKRNIVVSNSAMVYNEQCAMHVLCFILAQARNLPYSLKTRVESGTKTWHDLRASCVPLQGQTVLIVGFGAIGKRLAELLEPFHMNVLAYRRKPRGDENVPVLSNEQLTNILSAQADHIVNLLPYSQETHHFFDEARFANVKRGSIFYNIGRGTTVDQTALVKALRSKVLKAAWLDVTDPEPLPDNHPLLSEPNCFITPHVAGGDSDEVMKLVKHFIGNLHRFSKGEKLLDTVM